MIDPKEADFFGYKVCSDGRIYGKNGLLKYRLSDSGYPIVSMWINGKNKLLKVHRVLAISFIPNPENKPCVNHIDRNRQNYNLDNLEWVTYAENYKHSWECGVRRKKSNLINFVRSNPARVLNKEQVEAIRFLYKSGYSQNKLARIFPVGQAAISKIVLYQCWIDTGSELTIKEKQDG